MKKKINKFLPAIIVAAVLLVSLLITQIYAVSVKISLENLRSQSPADEYSQLTEDTSLGSQPSFLSLSLAKLDKGQSIKVVSKGENWSEVVVFFKDEVKKGYIKTSLIGDSTNETIYAQSISFEKNGIKAFVGETVDLSPKITPSYSNENIKWASDNSKVAKVEDGKVTLLAQGETYITATTEKCSNKIKVTVTENPSKFAFKINEITVNDGEKFSLDRYLETDSAKGKNVKWSSTDSTVLNVNGSDLSADSEGSAVITATSGDKRAHCRVKVRNKNKNAEKPLEMKNIYGNSKNVHPSVVSFDEEWNGYRYWAAVTPYEKCDDIYENPHIYASNDLQNWETPKGFTNPLEPVPENYAFHDTYNSDTELVYNTDTNKLECWWRYYSKSQRKVVIYRKTTSDGVHWGAKEAMFTADIKKLDLLSPALVYEDGLYKMWTINPNKDFDIEYRESKDGKTWSNSRKIKLEYENPKLSSWHLDVIRTPKGYEMAVSAFKTGTGNRLVMNLYYAFSADNETYTKGRLLLTPSRGENKWDSRGIYRSSLLYANQKYYLFYSGIDDDSNPMGVGLISGNNVFHMQ